MTLVIPVVSFSSFSFRLPLLLRLPPVSEHCDLSLHLVSFEYQTGARDFELGNPFFWGSFEYLSLLL
jgi:hypothetical protein